MESEFSKYLVGFSHMDSEFHIWSSICGVRIAFMESEFHEYLVGISHMESELDLYEVPTVFRFYLYEVGMSHICESEFHKWSRNSIYMESEFMLENPLTSFAFELEKFESMRRIWETIRSKLSF
jgi:hypothetical protein